MYFILIFQIPNACIVLTPPEFRAYTTRECINNRICTLSSCMDAYQLCPSLNLHHMEPIDSCDFEGWERGPGGVNILWHISITFIGLDLE